MAVSIPAAAHDWTGGVVFQAKRAAKMLPARCPGLKVIVTTSPKGASQANALEDLKTLVTKEDAAQVSYPDSPL